MEIGDRVAPVPMSGRLTRHLRAHAIAYVALVLALSGTAVAVTRNSVGDRELAPDSVGASELENNAVGSANVKNGALSAADFGDGECGYVGQLLLVGWNDFAPTGTLAANGQILNIENQQPLYSLYGNTFGGNLNATPPTFGLPNIPPPVAGAQYVVCVEGIYPSRP